MLKLDLPFQLTESSREAFLKRSQPEGSSLKAQEVILDALSISIATGSNTYQVISDHRPEPDGATPFRGMLWPRCLLPLGGGATLEQQMMFPATGNAIAFSWRVLGRATARLRLTASPVFTGNQPFTLTGFEIEPETNGGRLGWRPYRRSSQIIADTNGRFIATDAGSGPGSFEFALGPHPSVLIFSSEPRSESGLDPLIGGFLAQLTEERSTMTARRLLAAA